MSTLRVDNFAPSAGGTSFGIEGVAKALVNYNQTVPTVNGSENLSSVTDNAAGNFTMNLTNAMANTAYAGSGSAADATVTSALSIDSYGTTAVVCLVTADVAGYHAATSEADRTKVSATLTGDLA